MINLYKWGTDDNIANVLLAVWYFSEAMEVSNRKPACNLVVLLGFACLCESQR